MKIRHHEIKPDSENPFAECKLGREPYARILTDIVGGYADGFVMAINNEWGTGKTTFVKMWQQQLKNEGYQTVYFNAWENDFDSNPLVALMSELEELTDKDNKKKFNSVLKKGAVLARHIAPAVLKAIAKKYIDTEVLLDALENSAKASVEILEEEIKEYTKKKKTIQEFKIELEEFVEKLDNKALIFIIDEIDRCRPDYAVEVLEQIKHFFSVKGIVFVLSIDKNQLANAIKGFYGSEGIDTNEYLRRFIDLEYSIPDPSTKDFVNYLFDYYSFGDFFHSTERNEIADFKDDQETLLKIAEFLMTKSNSTLRQQERMFALTRLILCSFTFKQYAFPHLILLLVYLKTIDNNQFQKIERNELSLQGLNDLLDETIFAGNDDFRGLRVVYFKALLLWFYNNNESKLPNHRIELFTRDNEGNLTTPVISKHKLSNDFLAGYFENVEKLRYSDLTLSYLIKRINLTEPITIQ